MCNYSAVLFLSLYLLVGHTVVVILGILIPAELINVMVTTASVCYVDVLNM